MPAGQLQHAQYHRKVDLRQQLLTDALAGAAWIPYCGDGDLAADCYQGRPMYGCDSDVARVNFIRERLPSGHWFNEDAEDHAAVERMIGSTLGSAFAVGDFDAYAYPYEAFRAFWQSAPRQRRLVLFFTDGGLLNVSRGGAGWRRPDGSHEPLGELADRRKIFNFYWTEHLLPWLTAAVAPWTVKRTEFYKRGVSMIYWGAVVEAPANFVETERRQPAAAADVIDQAPPDLLTRLLSAIVDVDLRDELSSYFSRSQKDEPNHEGLDPDSLTDEELGYDPMKVQAFDAKKKRRFLHLVATGSTLSAAARAVGVTPRTVYNHFERPSSFKEAFSYCVEEANDAVENSLYKAALSGNVTAAQVWLYNRAPDRWSDKRNHSVKMVWDEEGLALIADIITRAALDPESLSRVRAELARVAASGTLT